jgi:hypothetical protein
VNGGNASAEISAQTGASVQIDAADYIAKTSDS